MRLIWADSLKGWLMILVIIGHAIQTVLGTGCDTDHTWNLIYSFHMPAFMAVSGWLAYRSGSPKLTAWGG
ncbi:MAG: acyltransferase family protein [Bacteroidaceae bacterium]|nr:acyltransferase family protein [Bacteroidaceae bacterium]